MSDRKSVIIEMRDRDTFDRAKNGELPGETLDLDHAFDTVEIPSDHDGAGDDGTTHLARGEVHHEDIDELEDHPEVLGVWSDGKIGLFGTGAPAADTKNASDLPLPPKPWVTDFNKAFGDLADVAAAVGADELWAQGIDGHGVTVADVGGGMTAVGRPIAGADKKSAQWPMAQIPHVTGGWPENWGTTSVAMNWHGNVMATGILGLAPNAEIFDIRIVEDGGSGHGVKGMISDALKAYKWAIDSFKATGKPNILNNSWGLYTQASAPNYATHPDHPFTRKVELAIDTGMVVLFSAGNCGMCGAAPGCDPDIGPGQDIWGANGAPAVMTIAGATSEGAYIGYSAQGPAALDKQKPDFCSLTQYQGYNACDYGTSSACCTASGIAALLKCACPDATHADIKAALQKTAAQIGDGPWNYGSGSGIVRVPEAVAHLKANMGTH
ncbi:MAG: S8 family serine peptidase [Pseudomonadota bacterium]